MSWLWLCAVLAVSSASVSVESSTYSFYVFSIEWKPTMCRSTKCVSGYYSEAFNIHGLWPSTSPSQGPSNCGGAAFSVSSSVQQLMETCWKSDSGADMTFWEHEWEKHGTCVVPATTPDAYFTKAVSLFQQFALQSTLARSGVTPSSSKEYTVSQLYSAFSKKVNAQCYCSSGTCYLEAVKLCLDLSYALTDCQEVDSGCSSGQFLLPSSD